MKTETQQDSDVRIVALANLRAMCARVSSMSHRFRIEKVTRSRVHVSYTGPYYDSQGYEGQDIFVVAVFPCYPSPWSGDSENPRVILDALRILHEDQERDYDAGQYFDPLLDCPNLWRVSAESSDWRTRTQWEKETGKQYRYPVQGSMTYDALPSILRQYVNTRTEALAGWQTSPGIFVLTWPEDKTLDEEMETLLEGFEYAYPRRIRDRR